MRPQTEPAMHIEKFADTCENCHQLDRPAPFMLREHRDGFLVDHTYCDECIDEVIQSRYRCRNVSDMTAELRDKEYREIYNRVYDKINFPQG